MPYFRKEDEARKSNSWADEAHDVLVLAIQTVDELPRILTVKSKPLAELRQRLDLILNSKYWTEQRWAPGNTSYKRQATSATEKTQLNNRVKKEREKKT